MTGSPIGENEMECNSERVTRDTAVGFHGRDVK